MVTRFVSAVAEGNVDSAAPLVPTLMLGPGIWSDLRGTDSSMETIGTQMDIALKPVTKAEDLADESRRASGRLASELAERRALLATNGMKAWALLIRGSSTRPLSDAERDLFCRVLPDVIPCDADTLAVDRASNKFVFALKESQILYIDDLSGYEVATQETTAKPARPARNRFETFEAMKIRLLSPEDAFARNYTSAALTEYLSALFAALDERLRALKHHGDGPAVLAVELRSDADPRLSIEPTDALSKRDRQSIAEGLTAVPPPKRPDTTLEIEIAIDITPKKAR